MAVISNSEGQKAIAIHNSALEDHPRIGSWQSVEFDDVDAISPGLITNRLAYVGLMK